MLSIGECEIFASFMSDHNIIGITLNDRDETKHGRGTWKFNSRLLADNEYKENMNILIDEWINKYRDVKDARLKWDVIKTKIRGFTISYCSHKAKLKRQMENELLK